MNYYALSRKVQIKRHVRDPDNGDQARQPIGKPKRNMMAYMLMVQHDGLYDNKNCQQVGLTHH